MNPHMRYNVVVGRFVDYLKIFNLPTQFRYMYICNTLCIRDAKKIGKKLDAKQDSVKSNRDFRFSTNICNFPNSRFAKFSCFPKFSGLPQFPDISKFLVSHFRISKLRDLNFEIIGN